MENTFDALAKLWLEKWFHAEISSPQRISFGQCSGQICHVPFLKSAYMGLVNDDKVDPLILTKNFCSGGHNDVDLHR